MPVPPIPTAAPNSAPIPSHPPVTLTVDATGTTLTAQPVPLPALDAPHAHILYIDDTPDAISTLLHSGSYVLPRDFRLLPALTPPGGRVLDLGAHIGTFSLTAAALGYAVVAVEASPHNATLLRQSVVANEFAARIQVVPRAVGDRMGEVEFVAAGPYGFIANPKVQAPTVKVPLTTVPQILREVGWEQVDFIKLDVEGSEPAVLRGLRDLLARPDAPPILVEVNGHTLALFDETPQSLFAQLEALGYRCYLLRNEQLVPVQTPALLPEVQADCLAVKRPLPMLRHWTLAPHATHAELVQRFVAAVGPEDATGTAYLHARQHVGRTLAHAPLALLGNAEVIALMDRLAADADASVHATVAWWHAGNGESMRAQVLRAAQTAAQSSDGQVADPRPAWRRWLAHLDL